MHLEKNQRIKAHTHKQPFCKSGVSCFYDSEVLNSRRAMHYHATAKKHCGNAWPKVVMLIAANPN